MTIPITNWPSAERPREKLLKQGSQSLSDAELLAIFLRTGVKGKTAVDLGRDLIQNFSGLRGIFESSQSDFTAHHGMGPAKYVQLQACLEMVKRYLSANLEKSSILELCEDTEYFLVSQMRHEKKEIFSALFLDTQCRLIAYEEMFRGTLGEVAIHPREVIKRALAHNAANLVIAHNHPSGITSPSKSDLALTQTLKAALNLIGVNLIDHMIIGEGKIFSFSEKGLL